MSYAFMKLVPLPDGDGLGPGFPDGVGFAMLADHRESSWALCHYDSSGGWVAADPVTPELASLIEQAKDYPPALALARVDLSKTRGDRLMTPAQMAVIYSAALSSRLSARTQAPYIRARARRTEFGYLDEGEWCWLLAVNPVAQTVWWVSSDYYVYTNPISDFEITDRDLAQLPSRVP